MLCKFEYSSVWCFFSPLTLRYWIWIGMVEIKTNDPQVLARASISVRHLNFFSSLPLRMMLIILTVCVCVSKRCCCDSLDFRNIVYLQSIQKGGDRLQRAFVWLHFLQIKTLKTSKMQMIVHVRLGLCVFFVTRFEYDFSLFLCVCLCSFYSGQLT